MAPFLAARKQRADLSGTVQPGNNGQMYSPARKTAGICNKLSGTILAQRSLQQVNINRLGQVAVHTGLFGILHVLGQGIGR